MCVFLRNQTGPLGERGNNPRLVCVAVSWRYCPFECENFAVRFTWPESEPCAYQVGVLLVLSVAGRSRAIALRHQHLGRHVVTLAVVCDCC